MESQHKYLFEQLIQSPDPELTLSVWKENDYKISGLKYLPGILERAMLKVIDDYVFNEKEILNNVMLLNPGLPENETGVQDLKQKIKKAQMIKQFFEPQEKKDTRFMLTSFCEEQEQTKYEYKSFQREIKNNGCFIVKTETDSIKIYTPELVVILTSKELPSKNLDTQTETKINGWEYFETYFKAYKEGEQYFEKEFKVPPTTLYGENAEQYVRDIHNNFFHTGVEKYKGWGYVKNSYPDQLTHESIKKFGYYSGIVNKVEEQVTKHPRLFQTFDKCEHQQPEAETELLKVQRIAKDIDRAFDNFKKKEYLILHPENWNEEIAEKYFEWTIEVKHSIAEYLKKYHSEKLIKEQIKTNIELLDTGHEILINKMFSSEKHKIPVRIISAPVKIKLQEHYFFFRKFLSETIDSIKNKEIQPLEIRHEAEKGISPIQESERKPKKLKVNQIALIHVYREEQITRENAGKIAAKHGYTSKNSGEGLFQDYTNYCSPANRKGKPTLCTPKKLKNKIDLFESIVEYLNESEKLRALDEIKILKTIFDNEYQ